MKIGRMKEGNLYNIKKCTVIEKDIFVRADKPNSSAINMPVLKGWREPGNSETRPPFIYLGCKHEDWIYSFKHTNKVHYILWKEDIYIMDNQFAKHIEPVWIEE